MPQVTFDTLRFEECAEGLQVTFLTMFQFIISISEASRLGARATKEGLEVKDNAAERKLNALLLKGFEKLKNKLNGKRAVYVHKNSGIPLLGSLAFGIIDRGTRTIEVRPITACNIRCVYCSVDEDQRPVDFVVEADYLVEETSKVLEQKHVTSAEILINSQGEPTLYHDMVRLVQGMRNLKRVTEVTLITNGTLLTKQKVDELIKAGLTRVNLSLNAMTHEKARRIADAGYSLKAVLEFAKYVSERLDLVIAPVWIPGYNDNEMDALCEFVSSLKNERFAPRLCIQNFLPYSHGRNPVEPMPMESFYAKLKTLEQKHSLVLIPRKEDFPATTDDVGELPKPFAKGDIVKAVVIGPGRLTGETLTVAKGRTISVMKCASPPGSSIKVCINRTKHNIFGGVSV